MQRLIAICVSISAALAATAASGQSSEQQQRAEEAAKKRSLEEALTNPMPSGSPLLGPENTTPVGAPIVAFKGCAAPKGGSGGSADTSDRMRTRQSSQTDPVTARVFAAQEITEQAATQDTLENDCRYRFDGVWMQDVLPQFDKSEAGNVRIPAVTESLPPELTYTAFTSPVYIYIEMLEDGEALSMRPATTGHKPFLLRSRDGIPLSRVLRPNGEVKTYFTVPDPKGGAQLPPTPLYVNVTRFGKMRLRWAKQDFVRPAPSVSAKADVSAGDVFAVGYNLDNLGASMRGYDIIKQNPLKLNENDGGLGQVFAKADPLDYAIVEKRTVPLGLKLIPHGDQGSVMQSRLITSKVQFQKTVSTSLGVKVGVTALSPKGEALPAKGSASAGVNYAESKTRGMSAGIRNSMASSIARHRLYSLLLDEPFTQLSQEFIEAIDDAKRFGRFEQLIEKFGTHYPRAVTYGSAAWKHNSYAESTIAQWRADSKDVNVQAGLSLGGFSMESSTGRFVATQGSASSTVGVTTEESDAVGGTGGQDTTTGTPYPILADLRPLHELLNPLNFPQEPEVYGPVRDNLARAIADYLEKNTKELSAAPVQPQQQTWRITARWVRCLHGGAKLHVADMRKVQMRGTISLKTVDHPASNKAASLIYPFRADGETYKEWSCDDTQSGSGNTLATRDGHNSLTVTGNLPEIKRYTFKYRAELTEVNWNVFGEAHNRNYKMNSPDIKIPAKANSKVGDYYTRKWQIKHPSPYYPLLQVNYRIERVR